MPSRRRVYSLVALALGSACVIPAALWVFRLREYVQEQRAGRELVVQLQHGRPADIDPETWEWATNWAITAYCNVCFSPEHVSLEELRRFNADLEERLRGPVDLETVHWVWDRLGRTGPHGKSYQERFEPQYREGLGVAGQRRER
jgi:hypothetical protein